MATSGVSKRTVQQEVGACLTLSRAPWTPAAACMTPALHMRQGCNQDANAAPMRRAGHAALRPVLRICMKQLLSMLLHGTQPKPNKLCVRGLQCETASDAQASTAAGVW